MFNVIYIKFVETRTKYYFCNETARDGHDFTLERSANTSIMYAHHHFYIW